MYDGAFITKIISRKVCSQKSSVVDARLGSTPLLWEDSSNVLFLYSIARLLKYVFDYLHYKTFEICFFFKVLHFF